MYNIILVVFARYRILYIFVVIIENVYGMNKINEYNKHIVFDYICKMSSKSKTNVPTIIMF